METTQKVMVGSEKQVVWATQIKAGWITQLDDTVTSAQVRLANGSMPAAWLTLVTEIADNAKAKLDNWTAKMIIDNRTYAMRQIADSTAIEQWEKR